jgi:hypothetical protein
MPTVFDIALDAPESANYGAALQSSDGAARSHCISRSSVRFRYSLTGRKSSWQKAREKGEALPSWLSIKKIGLVDRRGAVRQIEAQGLR